MAKQPVYKNRKNLTDEQKRAIRALTSQQAKDNIMEILSDADYRDLIATAMEQSLKRPRGSIEIFEDREANKIMFVDHSTKYEESKGVFVDRENAKWVLSLDRHYRGMTASEVIADKIKWDDWATETLVKLQESSIGNLDIDTLKTATSDDILSQYINMTDYSHRQKSLPSKKQAVKSEKIRLTEGLKNQVGWLVDLVIADDSPTLNDMAKKYYKSIEQKLAKKGTNKYYAQIKHFMEIENISRTVLGEENTMWDSESYHLPEFFDWVYSTYLKPKDMKWRDLTDDERQAYYLEYIGKGGEPDNRPVDSISLTGQINTALAETQRMLAHLLESDIRERKKGRKSSRTPEEIKARRVKRMERYNKRLEKGTK